VVVIFIVFVSIAKNFGVHEPFNGAVRGFIEAFGLFDFHLTREQFENRIMFAL
jgi:hypothetical protein